jgi:predicted small lipoprotein YifL
MRAKLGYSRSDAASKAPGLDGLRNGRMPMTAGRIFTALALVATMALVSACGRKAGLDTPYEAAVQARKDALKAKDPNPPPEPAKPDTDKPFILDRLIQ